MNARRSSTAKQNKIAPVSAGCYRFFVTPSAAPDALTINEVFYSIQGESSFAGRPCVFVRLTGCDLRCTYCDTEYAFYEVKKRLVPDLVKEVAAYRCPLVEITGGEPLLQKKVHGLMTHLCDAGHTVLIETGGAHDIGGIDPRVHRIMDLKCPSSGESGRNRVENLALLGPRDEVKFVIGTEEDYLWAKRQVQEGEWARRVNTVIFSPVFGKMELLDMAQWILRDHLPVRMQVQLHKLIWEPNTRGV